MVDAGARHIADEFIAVHGVQVRIPEGAFAFADAPHTLVRLSGPIEAAWPDTLAAAGVVILFWCPRYGACVRLPSELRSPSLSTTFPFLAGAQPYTEALCSRALPTQTGALRRATGVPQHVYDLVCFTRSDRERVTEKLTSDGVEVLATSSTKIRVLYTGNAALLRDLVGVKLVDEARAPVLLAGTTMSHVLGLQGVAADWRTDFTGNGQTIAVADTGLDSGSVETLHDDLRDRVSFLRSWPINPSWTPFVRNAGAEDGAADVATGHGTHVAGLAVGTGVRSSGRYRGVAPGARLVFQAIEQYTETRSAYTAQIPTGFYLSGRPLDLRELFREAREQGARIHVNSWGDPARGQYTDDCYEADLFLRENPDAVILYAAGNDGCDRDGNRRSDERSVYAPATAKNVIAVGATEGGEYGVGFRGTWGDMDKLSQKFRAAADRSDSVSGEPERIALNSSTGPTADGRIKPDICTCGTNLVATRSTVTSRQGWGLASPMPHYMYNGGTSMATAVAGGFVALLREAWQKHLGAAPSGAALKALLVAGAKPVRARWGETVESRFAAGFGRLHFEGCAPPSSNHTIELYDETANALFTGDVREHALVITEPCPFRAVLAWYDAPGETLVNDLDLVLVDADGTPLWGNGGNAPDRVNTIEVIDLPLIDAGTYTLRVVGSNVPSGPQPYALVVTARALRTATPQPVQPRTGIPVEFLVGIGARTAARLAANGAGTVDMLQRISDDQLKSAGALDVHRIYELRTRLRLLSQIVSRALPPNIPRTQTLDRVSDPWLAQLTAIFNRSRLRRISLADLF